MLVVEQRLDWRGRKPGCCIDFAVAGAVADAVDHETFCRLVVQMVVVESLAAGAALDLGGTATATVAAAAADDTDLDDTAAAAVRLLEPSYPESRSDSYEHQKPGAAALEAALAEHFEVAAGLEEVQAGAGESCR